METLREGMKWAWEDDWVLKGELYSLVFTTAVGRIWVIYEVIILNDC